VVLCTLFAARRRNADIEAISECTLWALDRKTFRRIIASAASSAIQSKVDFLQRCAAPSLDAVAVVAPLHFGV
jgi:CRP-like cAMP-binding protein